MSYLATEFDHEPTREELARLAPILHFPFPSGRNMSNEGPLVIYDESPDYFPIYGGDGKRTGKYVVYSMVGEASSSAGSGSLEGQK